MRISDWSSDVCSSDLNINPGNLAFETRVFRMEIDKDGNIVETPADQDFLVFPPQGVLPAGGRQVVRLQWVGGAELATSQAYYVSVEQLPVAFEPKSEEHTSELQSLMHISYAVFCLKKIK